MQEFVSCGCSVSACDVRYVAWVHLQRFCPRVPAPKPKVPRETLWGKAGAAPHKKPQGEPIKKLSAFLCDQGKVTSSPFPKIQADNTEPILLQPAVAALLNPNKTPNRCKWEKKRGRRLGPVQLASRLAWRSQAFAAVD